MTRGEQHPAELMPSSCTPCLNPRSSLTSAQPHPSPTQLHPTSPLTTLLHPTPPHHTPTPPRHPPLAPSHPIPPYPTPLQRYQVEEQQRESDELQRVTAVCSPQHEMYPSHHHGIQHGMRPLPSRDQTRDATSTTTGFSKGSDVHPPCTTVYLIFMMYYSQ